MANLIALLIPASRPTTSGPHRLGSGVVHGITTYSGFDLTTWPPPMYLEVSHDVKMLIVDGPSAWGYGNAGHGIYVYVFTWEGVYYAAVGDSAVSESLVDVWEPYLSIEAANGVIAAYRH